uniref:proline-rich protein 2-like n=1 Tax=Nyctereutes procyonoides TaxID=34880 RepID=UPI00244443A0|nr:proline-rich protein 2-like [Nyctereutes procyonoides]
MSECRNEGGKEEARQASGEVIQADGKASANALQQECLARRPPRPHRGRQGGHRRPGCPPRGRRARSGRPHGPRGGLARREAPQGPGQREAPGVLTAQARAAGPWGPRVPHTSPFAEPTGRPKANRTESARRPGFQDPAPGSPPRAPARGAPAPAPAPPPTHLPPRGAPPPPPAFLGEGGLLEHLRAGPAPPGLLSDRGAEGRAPRASGPHPRTCGGRRAPPPGPTHLRGRREERARRPPHGNRASLPGRGRGQGAPPGFVSRTPARSRPEGRARPAPRSGGAGPSSARRGAAHAPRKGPDRWA